MNQIEAKVQALYTADTGGEVHIVAFSLYNTSLFMMSLELHPKLCKDAQVVLQVKPTHVGIARQSSTDLSFLNQIEVTILSIEVGELLCVVQGALQQTVIEAVIATTAYHRMNLQVGERVVMLFLASELSVSHFE